MTIDLSEISVLDRQHYLQHLIAPRPICFASTVNTKGEVNLSPFSFFNLVSTNPPIVIFSPNRRVRNNTTKHTLENVKAVPEVTINIVDYDMVQQTSLASCEYPEGVNEFIKSGFTMLPSTLVKPPMVKESKGRLECKVINIISLGDTEGSGNLVVCEVLRIHIDDSILGANDRIDQTKLHHVARLGGNWYCKVDESNLFEVEKPNVQLGIGFDNLPENIRNSTILTGNHLGILANVETLPLQNYNFSDPEMETYLHQENANDLLQKYAARLLDNNKVQEAWQVLLRMI